MLIYLPQKEEEIFPWEEIINLFPARRERKEVDFSEDCPLLVVFSSAREYIRSMKYEIKNDMERKGDLTMINSRQKKRAWEIARVSRLIEYGVTVDEPRSEELTSKSLFGVKIGVARRRLGLEIEDLAKKVDMDADILLAIELGAAPYQVVKENLKPLGEALGLDYAQLARLLYQCILYDE